MIGKLTTKHSLTLEDLTNKDIKNLLTILIQADIYDREICFSSQEKETLLKLKSIINEACNKLPKD
ncbi:hypothetical protein [Pelosinus sp. IPA-1]|uniref:hypothetical protein n=1 Tax=Pelosinus sp. IPA-1 TaxID=3029569 RepID=UPI0024362A44|nr:hypothetical protein [Pelosinus sp. IPA-1]GMB00915.1 hypothetical protein PIPA1_37140 [Pelosinus sp. IPA-1]